MSSTASSRSPSVVARVVVGKHHRHGSPRRTTSHHRHDLPPRHLPLHRLLRVCRQSSFLCRIRTHPHLAHLYAATSSPSPQNGDSTGASAPGGSAQAAFSSSPSGPSSLLSSHPCTSLIPAPPSRQLLQRGCITSQQHRLLWPFFHARGMQAVLHGPSRLQRCDLLCLASTSGCAH